MAEKPPPHPPRQAVHPGRPTPKPHAQAEHHAAAMKRPNEKLHLACHCLGGRHHHRNKDDAPPSQG